MIAPCGIDCSECPAYIGTQTNNMEQLEETAKKWSDESHQYDALDLICDGCSSERLHVFCLECRVRLCAEEKGCRVCSLCSDYPCDILEEVWSLFTGQSISGLKLALEQERTRTI
ncbi:MAG: hypothetical protein AM326_08340 [Candidatus Thorarchaeota archaeon SMTZ-45]|nr:MAG: hypothetical protein AM326_08340 [Candidatus Thorarchaeota archaeon SMTZ-45]